VATQKFNEGYCTFHQEEIEVGKALFNAAVLIHGKVKLRRLIKSDPSKAFAPLRYGRRFIPDLQKPGSGHVCVMIDRDPFYGGKASNRYILVPGRKGWKRFVKHVHSIINRPRWADGLTASAEALDELGYAIAESVASMLALGIETDDCCVMPGRR
jgi:hypothetical protein